MKTFVVREASDEFQFEEIVKNVFLKLEGVKVIKKITDPFDGSKVQVMKYMENEFAIINNREKDVIEVKFEGIIPALNSLY
ncbi:hypothetical protein [Guggenheimella bovis]